MHIPTRGKLEIFQDALISVDADGNITEVLTPSNSAYNQRKKGAEIHGELRTTDAGQYILPGLIDTHIHAPQWPQLGKALHLPLPEWLQANTFPLEAKYEDVDFARRMYTSLVDNLLANGTTTAVYFATIHQEATRVLADICLQKGQRAFIGKVAMDDKNQCPEYYRDASADVAEQGTRKFIEYTRSMPGNSRKLVQPVITPRFIPSCSDDLLSKLARLAEESHCHIQTHCSESDWEHDFVLKRFGITDTAVLNNIGLLRRHTVLAHCNRVTREDMKLIAEKGAGVAHCPLSNSYFANNAFPLRAALGRGVRVGLGTDISGGPSASIFDSCRHAVSTSLGLHNMVDSGKSAKENSRIDFKDSFWLATMGAAEVLDVPSGSFMIGRQFDAILINTKAKAGGINIFEELDDLHDVFQKIVHGATRTNIEKVWVAGRQVKD